MIELEGVCKNTADGTLFSDLNLRVDTGEVLIVSGASSAGKTTLLHLLFGAARPDSGIVNVFGRDVSRLRRSSIALLRRKIGVCPQEIRLLEDRSALENVCIPLEIRALRRKEIRSRAVEALAMVGLALVVDEPAARLSSGQRRLVAFARAVVGEPEILLVDEPTNDLDSIRKDELCSLVEEMRAKNATCILTTNDTQVIGAAALCGWRHQELRGGKLQVVDFQIPTAAETDVSNGVPNVVPFPYAWGGSGVSPTNDGVARDLSGAALGGFAE